MKQKRFFYRSFPVLLMCLFMAACQTLPAKTTTHQNFTSLWEQRLEQYKAEFITQDKVIRERDGKGFGVDLAKVPDPWKIIMEYSADMSTLIRQAYTTAGKGETIKAFIIHIQKRPSAGMTDVWFHNRADDIKREGEEVERITKAFFQNFDEKIHKDASWLIELEAMVKAQGMVIGKNQELESLYKQSISYYTELARSEVEDRYRAEQSMRAGQALLAAGAYFNNLNYQQQLLNTVNRPRTCTVTGNSITCF